MTGGNRAQRRAARSRRCGQSGPIVDPRDLRRAIDAAAARWPTTFTADDFHVVPMALSVVALTEPTRPTLPRLDAESVGALVLTALYLAANVGALHVQTPGGHSLYAVDDLAAVACGWILGESSDETSRALVGMLRDVLDQHERAGRGSLRAELDATAGEGRACG